MTGQLDELAEWSGRELLDADAKTIGTIAGLGYPRRRFGTAWLLVETAARRVLVPADQIRCSGERLILPYSGTYVVEAPGPEHDQPLSKAEERRLRLHYGIDSGMPNGGCSQGCGLCQAQRKRRAAAARSRR